MNKEKEYYRINDQIRVNAVRLVGDNVLPGIYEIRKAIQMAKDLNVDLVEINKKSDIPICKLMDFQKFLYEKKRKQKENEKNQFKQKIKEVRFTPNIGDHDYNFKLKQCIEFLKEKHKLQVGVFFQGRMIKHVNFGYDLILRLTEDLETYGRLENQPKIDGKKLLAIYQPK